MRKTIAAIVIAAGLIPLLLNAGDGQEVRDMLEKFRKYLQEDNYQAAAACLSPRFINALKAGSSSSGDSYPVLQEDPVEFVKKELDGTFFEDFQIASVKEDGDIATANLKLTSGKIVKLFLRKDPSAGWQITPAPPNVFEESQKKDEERIGELDAKRQAVEWRQHLADDINGLV